jgi:hypothetical protein
MANCMGMDVGEGCIEFGLLPARSADRHALKVPTTRLVRWQWLVGEES